MAPVGTLALVFALVLAAACSGGNGGNVPETQVQPIAGTQELPPATVDPSGRPPPTTINITVATDGLSFSPHQVHGNMGDQLVVTLVGSAEQHSFTIDALGLNEDLMPNATRTIRFTAPPTEIAPFYCRFHGSERSGMHGLLVLH
jgi:heme/copper-type cytochrome/quinol oxidase subunit 2